MVDSGVGHKCYTTFLVLAGILITASIALGIVAVVYEKWIYYQVDSSLVNLTTSSPYDYYNRSRGIFWECVTNTNAPVLTYYQSLVTKGNCFYVDIFLIECVAPSSLCSSSTYWYIVQMRIAHLSLLILGLFIDFIGFIAAIKALIMLCIQTEKHRDRQDRASQILIGSLFMIGGVISMSSFIVFHCFISAEKEVTASNVPHTYASWPQILQFATAQTYGAAYVIGWVYVGCSLFAGLILLLVRKYTCCQCALEKQRREPDTVYAVYGNYTTDHLDYSGQGNVALSRVSFYDLDVPSYYSTQLNFEGKPSDVIGKGHSVKNYQ